MDVETYLESSPNHDFFQEFGFDAGFRNGEHRLVSTDIGVGEIGALYTGACSAVIDAVNQRSAVLDVLIEVLKRPDCSPALRDGIVLASNSYPVIEVSGDAVYQIVICGGHAEESGLFWQRTDKDGSERKRLEGLGWRHILKLVEELEDGQRLACDRLPRNVALRIDTARDVALRHSRTLAHASFVGATQSEITLSFPSAEHLAEGIKSFSDNFLPMLSDPLSKRENQLIAYGVDFKELADFKVKFLLVDKEPSVAERFRELGACYYTWTAG